MLKLILISALLPISTMACNNDCWLEKNKNIVIQHPELKWILDKICEQGRPITKRERKIARRLHLKKCGHITPLAPATPTATPHEPTPTPHPTQTPIVTPTPSPSTPSPTPYPTGTPSVSPTVTPSATPTPTVSPSPTATPVCTPHGECTFSTIEWAAQYPDWPEAFPLQLGNHSYTKEQSFVILTYPGDAGDDLSRLCRELIAARLNIANGAGHDCADDFIGQSDELIGDLVPRPVGDDTHIPTPESTNLIFQLTNYNKGNLCCAEHCNIYGKAFDDIQELNGHKPITK